MKPETLLVRLNIIFMYHAWHYYTKTAQMLHWILCVDESCILSFFSQNQNIFLIETAKSLLLSCGIKAYLSQAHKLTSLHKKNVFSQLWFPLKPNPPLSFHSLPNFLKHSAFCTPFCHLIFSSSCVSCLHHSTHLTGSSWLSNPGGSYQPSPFMVFHQTQLFAHILNQKTLPWLLWLSVLLLLALTSRPSSQAFEFPTHEKQAFLRLRVPSLSVLMPSLGNAGPLLCVYLLLPLS